MRDYRRKHIGPKLRGLRNSKKLLQRTWFWIPVILLSIIMGVSGFLLSSFRFQVSTVHVSGNIQVKTGDLEDKAWQHIIQKMVGLGNWKLTTKNIFLVNKDTLAGSILKSFANVDEVTIQKKLPQEINIVVKEREPAAIFCQLDGSCFFVDVRGVAFQEAQPVDGMIVITQEGAKNVTLGQQIVSKETMNTIFKVQNRLQSNFQISIQKVNIANLFVFTTSELWQIYLDPKTNIDQQLTKMEVLLKDQINPSDRARLQYIYLQYKDRAYYK